MRGDEEDRLGDSPADRLVLLEMAPPPKGREHRVVERRAAIEVGGLKEDVVKHRPSTRYAAEATNGLACSALARGLAEEADRQQEAGDSPDRDHEQLVPVDRGPVPGTVGLEEGLEEVGGSGSGWRS